MTEDQYPQDNNVRPTPRVSEPLLAIRRPNARRGFSIPTDCAYLLVVREDGAILFQERDGTDSLKDIDYPGKFDLSANAAHVYDPETAGLSTLDIHFTSLMKKALKEVGINTEDFIADPHYTGTTTFKHTRDDLVFHNERHQVFTVRVGNDWQPTNKDGDVKTAFWATPEEAVRIIQDLPVQNFEKLSFNNNARAATIAGLIDPEIGVITPKRVGQDVYDSLLGYTQTHLLSLGSDPIHQELQRSAGFGTAFEPPARDV